MIYQLNKRGIQQIEAMCRRRVSAVHRNLARESAIYLLHFGYHAELESGPDRKNGPGWTAYYAANWNMSVASPDLSVLQPERQPFEKKDTRIGTLTEKEREAEGAFADAELSTILYVTNAVKYGKWLNEGAVDAQGLEFFKPNRFMELCKAHIKDQSKMIVEEAKEIE